MMRFRLLGPVEVRAGEDWRGIGALEAYGQARDAISGQLGVDPGAELRQLHADLLAKDTAPPVGVITAGVVSPPAEPAPEPRQARGVKRGGAQGPAQLPADVADFTGRDE